MERQSRLPGVARAAAMEPLEPRLLLAGQLQITEFMAVNDKTLADVDGDYSDWIEIRNASASPLNLSGWYLTDEKDTPTKWPLPAITLNAGEYRVVFASDKDRRDPAAELHTNFKLDGDGEYLALVRVDGQTTTVEQAFDPKYPDQIKDVSYGLGNASVVNDVLVGEGSLLRVLAPMDNTLGLTWTGAAAFDDSEWAPGESSAGYDTAGDYEGYIYTDIQAAMLDRGTSAYIRFSFDLYRASSVTVLTLRMRYDDGFVAFLNGTEVARPNAADPLTHLSAALTDRPDAQAVVFENISLNAFRGSLRDGQNILAIQGLNVAAGDGDFLIMPELVADISLVAGEVYFTTPTPRAANVQGTLGAVGDTKFSVDRGFYDAPFEVKISTDTPGAEIRYTLDGSKPTAAAGTKYAGSITISHQTTLRAGAFKPGYIPSNVDTQTYVFLSDVLAQPANPPGLPSTNWGHAGPDYEMDPEVVNSAAYSGTIRDDMMAVPTMSLVMNVNDLFGGGGQGIYISGENSERSTSIELIYPDGREGFQIDGAVEICGGTSTSRWKIDKLSMQITFKEPWGPTKLNFPVFGDDAADRYDTLILDARLNQCWAYGGTSNPEYQRLHAQYTRDQFAPDLSRLMGNTDVHGQPVHLYLNGLYWGLYILHERPDESFAAAYLGGEKEDYDVLKHNATTAINGPNAAANYKAQVLDVVRGPIETPAQYQILQQNLDLEDFINYMLLNFYLGNEDWAHQNWYATRNRVDPDGLWRYHCWDTEHILKEVNYNSVTKNNTGGPTEVHQRLRLNAEYLLHFADHVQQYMFNGGLFTPDGIRAEYSKALAQVDRAVVGESARWGDNQRATPYTRDVEWVAERDRLMNTHLAQRTGIVLNQLIAQGLYPNPNTVVAPTFSIDGSYQHGGTIQAGDLLSMAATYGTIYYTLDGSDPRLPGGGVSPTAVQYAAGSIPLNQSTRVRARALNAGTWSALNEAVYLLPDPPPLRITEIMYNPPGPSPQEVAAGYDSGEQFEFIEVRNIGDETLHLGGCRLDGGIRFTFPAVDLGPGPYAIVARNPAAFQFRYGDPGATVLGPYTGLLDNAGDHIVLRSDLGHLIHDFRYADGWYDLTDGEGYSLTIRDEHGDLALWDQQAGWKPSARANGTPGAGDDGVVPGAILISELLAHSDGADWIELYNTTAQDIPIDGWFLSDSQDDLMMYRIPAGTTVPAHDFLVLDQATYFGAAFALSELGDDLFLSSGVGGELGGYRQHVDFGASPNGVTFGRYVKTTGGSDFTLMATPTPEDPNSGPFIGPLVINEVMYHPGDPPPGGPFGDEDYEFVELYNRSQEVLDLTEFYIGDAIGFTFGWPAADASASAVWTLQKGAQATWTTNLPQAGTYQVYARWDGLDPYGNPRSLDSQALYAVGHICGPTTVLVDQNASPGQWVLLGSYSFSAGAASVTLTRGSDAPGEWTIADRVRFVKTGTEVIVDNADAGFCAIGANVTVLDPGEYVVLVRDLDAFDQRYDIAGNGINVAGEYSGNLANGGEKITLYRAGNPDPNGFIPFIRTDHVNYDDEAPWPVAADGTGASLCRIAAGNYGNDAGNWSASSGGGSPSALNEYTDVTPPAAPGNLTAAAVSSTRIDLAWSASSDPESGVDHYVIYRNGGIIGTSAAASYSDTGLMETATYTYEVAAVNGDNLTGPRSAPVQATPRPSLKSALALNSTHVRVTFGKPVEQASAQAVGSYIVRDEQQQPVAIAAAVRQADLAQVELTLSVPLVSGTSYTVQAPGVRDLAGNLVEDGAQATFIYSGVDPNLLAWWTFDENEGSISRDATGNGRDLTVVGATWVSAGRIRGAYRLTGTSGSYLIDDDGETYINGLSAMTVAVWVKADAVGTDRGIFTTTGRGTSSGQQIRHDLAGTNATTNVYKIYFKTTSVSRQYENQSNTQTTNWQHVAMTWTSGGKAMLYLDGVLQSYTRDDGTAAGTLSGADRVLLGQGRYTDWLGLIDDVRIYNVALSAQQIAELANLEPVSLDDPDYQAPQNGTLIVPAAQGVLANDADPDARPQPLTAQLATGVSHGQLALNADGSFQYTPTPGYLGTDSFTYRATDGLEYGAPATVTITVRDVTPPVVTVDPLLTSDDTPALSGAVDDDVATVVVTVAGRSYTASNNAGGAWTLPDDTIGAGLADGVYDVQVSATDSAGNVGYDATANELTVDTTPPAVTGFTRNDGADAPGRLVSLAIQFSEYVGASLTAADLAVRNDTTGQDVDLAAAGFAYDAPTRTARWDLAAVAVVPGYHTVRLPAAGLTDPAGLSLDGDGDGIGGDDWHVICMVALAGDTDLDGDVDFLDFLTVKGSFGSNPATWAMGDSDADNDVDFLDFLAAKSNFGQALSAWSAWSASATPTGKGGVEVLTPAGEGQAGSAAEAPAPPAAATAPAATLSPSTALPRADEPSAGAASLSLLACPPADALGAAGCMAPSAQGTASPAETALPAEVALPAAGPTLAVMVDQPADVLAAPSPAAESWPLLAEAGQAADALGCGDLLDVLSLPTLDRPVG